jgi:hypothetical protein
MMMMMVMMMMMMMMMTTTMNVEQLVECKFIGETEVLWEILP